MPFTFLPHQVPVLPIAGRGDRRWDGVALVAGSIAPDLFYVTAGWGWGPWGIPLWFDGHALVALPVVTLVAAALAVVVRRVVLAAAPLVVPDCGQFRFGDWWTISRRRPRWTVTIWSAAIGVLTHLVLDSFTHAHGWVVQNAAAFTTPLFVVAGHQVALYSILQYGGSLVGAVVAVEMLRRMGRRGRFAPDSGEPRPAPLSPAQVGLVAGGVLGGVVGGVLYAMSRSRAELLGGQVVESGASVVIMAFCWVAFAGLVAGSALALLFRPAESRSDLEYDPR